MLLGILQSILTGRLLGVAGFGLLGTIITFTNVVNNLASFRMGELVVKYVGHYTEKDDPQHAAAVFKAAALVEMLASVTAFLLICLLAPLGARYLAKDPEATSWFVLYGLVVLFNLVAESSTGLLQIFDRFGRQAAWNLAQSAVTLILIVIVFLLQGSMTGVLIAYILGKAVSAIGLSAAAMAEAGRRWGSRWWQASLSILRPQRRELAAFAVSTNLSASISLVTKDSELLWVSLFRTPVEAGYYRLALSLANLAQLPVQPMPQATYPELSRQVSRKNWSDVRQTLRHGSLLAGAYSLAATLGLAILGMPIIRYLYGAEYLPAYPALMILLVGYLVADTFYWRRIALLALGRPDFPTKLNAILAAIKMAGILLFVPTYGYLASAALLSAFYVTGSGISVWKTRRLIEQRLSDSPQGESVI